MMVVLETAIVSVKLDVRDLEAAAVPVYVLRPAAAGEQSVNSYIIEAVRIRMEAEKEREP